MQTVVSRIDGISIVFRGGLVGGTGVRSKGPICGVQSEEDVEWRV